MSLKTIRERIPDIIQHIEAFKPFLEFNNRLYKILEGQIREEVEASLSREIIDKSAYRRAIERIPPVNVLRKTSEKLSKVYTQPPTRRARKMADNDIIEVVVKESGLDASLAVANLIYNAMKSFALEPYVDHHGKHRFRVLAPHQFIPYGDDPTDPRKLTVFIKLLGNETTVIPARFDEAGSQISEERISDVDLYALYSDDEFVVIDSSGTIRHDKMEEVGAPEGVNTFGRIPFIYRSKSKLELIPYPNQEGFDISILIPKLLADLNYAAQFMSHSIIWTKNTNLEGQSINPDCVVDLGDGDEEGKDPAIGTIKPDIDIAGVLEMVQFQLNAHFTSIGIRAEKTSGMTNGRDVSGIAKAIDEADVSAEQKAQTEMFRGVERELWALFARMQVEWAFNGSVEESRIFSDDFEKSLDIIFGEIKVNKSTRQVIDEAESLINLGLISKLRALKMIYPEVSDTELKKWIKEAADEKEPAPAPAPQEVVTNNNGQFVEGNEVAANQEPSIENLD